ncbi:MAG TPA: hypothetical protein VK680_10930 [Solirubrobacteraceae bacterium]|jgi:hypothetical protein|nr:hypothetical protein [Solirubrobacteraceae bacterium]
MTNDKSDVMATMVAFDPAAGRIPDEAGREEVWRIVASAMADASQGRAPRARARALPRVTAVALVGLLLIVGAAFASGLITVGSPAKKVENFQIADARLGSVTLGSASILSLRASDPQGGAPWGLRVFTTTRGAGCIQVGRVVDGQIGVLGSDGAFGDDGQLHPLPVASTEDLACSALDANGQVFDNVSKGDELANGLVGPEAVPSRETPEVHDICAAAASTPAEQSSAQGRICPQSDERDLYYGLLGPQAESVTYLEDGKPVTVPTSGSEGAYLIVQNAPSNWQPNDAYGVGETGPIPVYSPITEIHYTSGAVCHPADASEPACAPNGIPAGYLAAESTPTASQAAAAVSSRLLTGADGHQEALVTFNAPLAISSVRDQYKLQWQKRPGSNAPEESISAGEDNVLAGQELTIRSGPLPSGSTQLHVVLQHASGPALFEGPGTTDVPVGSTSVDVP